ncbi:MAG: STAS domain-containing protein [Verrucomicrobiia bacterium]
MQISEAHEGDVLVLRPEGDIDLHHSPKLRALLQAKVKEKCPKLLVDFTAVPYIDSSGLATLVEYFQGSRAYAGKLALAGLNPRVRSVFDLVRLTEIFSIHDSLESAKQSLA